MLYKYICNSCKSLFQELDDNKNIESSLVRYAILICPYCKSSHIDLTEHAKLLLDRKAKINKIENEYEQGIN
jgi:Zn finger protein HypA/HybF involved in hydrogenase expression